MAKKKARPKTGNRTNRTAGRRPATAPDWGPAFLDALRSEGTVYHACARAAVARSTVYERRKTDPAFAAAFTDALEEATDALEREAIRRGSEGHLEPVIHQGRMMGHWVGPEGAGCEPAAPGATFVPLCVRRYSDTLLCSLLKWRRYGDRLEVSGDPERPVKHDHSGTVGHEHRLDPAALRAFHDDLATAGLGHLSTHRDGQPLDTKTPHPTG